MKQRALFALLAVFALLILPGMALAGLNNYWEPTIYVDGVAVGIYAAPLNPEKGIQLWVYTPPDLKAEVDKESLDVDGDEHKDFVLHLKKGMPEEICVVAKDNTGLLAIDFPVDGVPDFYDYGTLCIAFDPA